MGQEKDEFVGEVINEESDLILSEDTIASNLKIASSTVRKYSSLLVKSGYKFEKNFSGNRIYRLADQHALGEMVRLRKEAGLSVASAAQMISSKQMSDDDTRDISKDLLNQSREEIQIRAFAEMQRQLLEETNSMKEQIIQEMKKEISGLKSLADPQLVQENESLKKEIDELRQESAETNRILRALLEEKKNDELNTKKPKKRFLERFFDGGNR